MHDHSIRVSPKSYDELVKRKYKNRPSTIREEVDKALNIKK